MLGRRHGISKFIDLNARPSFSPTVYNATSLPRSQLAPFLANIVGKIGIIVYSSYVHRTFAGKVQLRGHG